MKAKIAILAIILLEMWILIGIKPEFGNADDFKWFVVMSLGAIVVGCIIKLHRGSHQACTLFGVIQEETFEKGDEIFKVLIQTSECGWPSEGMVCTKRGRTEYFCSRHDPESPWMSSWLDKYGIEIEKDKIVRFKKQFPQPVSST